MTLGFYPPESQPMLVMCTGTARSVIAERLVGSRISGMMRADDSFAKPRLSCYGIWCLTSRRRTR